MAQKVNIILVDDLDGTEGATETVAFGLDGDTYEIDLTAKHAGELRKAFGKYTEVARVVQRRRGRKPASLSTGPATKRTGSRKRTSTVEEIEAGKTVGSSA